MQIKSLNRYRIIHENGKEELINAETLIQALNNLTITEEESIVIQTEMLEKDTRTIIEEEIYPDDPEPTPPENEGDTDVGGEVPLPDITDDTEDRG